ncbi:hypothetical protein CK203_032140 [Vitis vinifera]|uniref:Uncharacterized protein n=1 Tax=Vitis vinifera TaxID=29760 RepID=A0A438IPG4_VITVI|nr:hypothetical protein CK203_032140 [Vitis vinifera]
MQRNQITRGQGQEEEEEEYSGGGGGYSGGFMAKCSAEDETAAEEAVVDVEAAHPYAFHVSGPRNVSSPNWRDLINSISGIIAIYQFLSIFVDGVFWVEVEMENVSGIGSRFWVFGFWVSGV